MARPRALSGFPEWLPQQRIVERAVIEPFRHVFELHSFAEIETRAVEPLGQLLRKGETSKEVYVVRRLQELDSEYDDATLGLHFDLTVPFARYVLENAGHLAFPFKRYQIQKVWRGERPQAGRFREFTQADIDIVGRDQLPFHEEVECACVMAEALGSLAAWIGPVRIGANNRKVSEGFYRGIGLTDIDEVLRWIDKLDKIGPDEVAYGLTEEGGGATPEQAAACLELAGISGADSGVVDRVRALAARLGAGSDLLEEGLTELGELLEATRVRIPGVLEADLKIARGLDYYTGSVFETTLLAAPALGSICSGGRYDNLVSEGSARFPGVGLSIGVSRLVSWMLGTGGAGLAASRSVPAAVWIAVTDEASRQRSEAVASQLRARGIPCDVSPNAAKFGKQIKAAD
ncbi:MAG: histidine--tRNA ligase, partial [Bifidobacteriaceae bacterium]|nr:histidine--tRNA ligase [Bifidobacteriaceae bacterium]